MMRGSWRLWLIAGGASILAACAVGPRVPAGQPCVAKAMTVTDQFDGARRGACRVVSARHVELHIHPESAPPINDSPWFAFRIDPRAGGTALITLRYKDGHHRYRPKLSVDGRTWHPLAESAVSVSGNGRRAKFAVPLTDGPVCVAAQELITPPVYDAWNRHIAEASAATLSELGRSRNGLPIYRLDAGAESNRDILFITGRQHPPEVSGAFAFFAFAETLLADTDLARRFMSRFRLVAIPLLNPDGVIAGHWRHNLGGVDLNRNWGPFTEPETQLVRDLLAELDAGGHRIRFFLDFHSTKRNVFYTQNDDFVTEPPGLMHEWLERAAKRIENYEFTNRRNPVSEQANSKNYMYTRYRIPTATYEVGDETDREAARDAARIFAEELMLLLLEQDY